MYSPTQILKQEPGVVKTAVLAVLAALVANGTIDVSAEAVAGWGLAIQLVLDLFYVRPLSVSKDALSKLDQ